MERRYMLAMGTATMSFLVVAWVTASEGVPFWEERETGGRNAPSSPLEQDPIEPPPTLLERGEAESDPIDLSFIGAIVAVLLAALVLFLAVRLVLALRRRWWRRTPKSRPPTADFETLPDVTAAVADVTADANELLRAGSPRNAIVRCWARLGEAVEETGLRPDPAETSSELTERVLGAQLVDHRAITALAELYREARFSEHELTEDDRQRAFDALTTLDAQLQQQRASVEPTP